jgi:hypothetical protein
MAGQRRCAALGFVLEARAPINLQLELQHTDGTTSDRVAVPLDHAATFAGVVEFEAAPTLMSAARARLQPLGKGLVIHDLFVITYG